MLDTDQKHTILLLLIHFDMSSFGEMSEFEINQLWSSLHRERELIHINQLWHC